MSKPDFTDAQTKLDRALDHIVEIESEIASFLATDFYSLRLELDQGEGRMKIVLDSLHQPNKRVNAIIGDTIGNLRSTLDYIAVALAYPITGKTDGTGFPFADDARGFAGEVRSSRCLGPCATAIQNHFISEVQAYRGGKGQNFWALNKLRNIDKHRLLISATQLAGITASWIDGAGNTVIDCTFSVEAGNSGAMIGAPLGQIKFTDQPRPAFEITLTQRPYVDGAPVTPFLRSLAHEVDSLLNSLKVIV